MPSRGAGSMMAKCPAVTPSFEPKASLIGWVHPIFFGLSRFCVFVVRRSSVLKGCNRDWGGFGRLANGGCRAVGRKQQGHHDGLDTGFGVLPSGGDGVVGQLDGRAGGDTLHWSASMTALSRSIGARAAGGVVASW